MSITDVRRLRAFALVLDLGSISAAATVLGYTQSAVSQQLAALEREMGEPLVDRSRRPFGPTPAGAALRPYVDDVLAALHRAEGLVDDVRGRAHPRLRLAAFPSALSSFVAPAVRDLRRSDAELVVQVLELETREAIEALGDGLADLAVVHHMPGVPHPTIEGMERHALLEDDLCVVLPERHRLASRADIPLGELEGEPFLVPRRDTPAGRFRSVVEHLCAQAGFAPRVSYEMDDLLAAQAFAAAGIAVVLMHRLTVTPPLPGVVVRRLAESPAGSRTVEALVPRGAHSGAVDRLLHHLVTAAGTLGVP
jgi:DNA-binding transcriptional LysR family regulator